MRSGSALYCEIDGIQVEADPSTLTPAGLFINTTSPADLNSEIEVFLRSDMGAATVHGLVVQVIDPQAARRLRRSPGYGLLFTELSDQDRAFLGLTRSSFDRNSVPPPPASPSRNAEPSGRHPLQRPDTEAAVTRRTPGAASGINLAVAENRAPDAARVFRELQESLERLRAASPWEVLGIGVNADDSDAKAALRSASKTYHPHRFAKHDDAEISAIATEIFVLHRQAFMDVSRANERRSRAEQSKATTLERSAKTKVAAPKPAATVAETEPQPRAIMQGTQAPTATRAESTSDPGQPASPGQAPRISGARNAASLLGRALGTGSRRPPKRPGTAANSQRSPAIPPPRRPAAGAATTTSAAAPRPPGTPMRAPGPRAATPPTQTEPSAEVLMARGLQHLAASRFKEAENDLGRALAADPEFTEATRWLHLCRARKAKSLGDQAGAVRHYRQLLALDPQHREALDEVRNNGKDGKDGGLLGKFFKGGR